MGGDSVLAKFWTMILDIFLLIFLLFTCLACLFWFYLLVYLMIYKVPLVSTQKKVIAEMVKLAKLKTGQKVYDLGCGFAPTLFYAAKIGPKNQYIGYDVLRPVLWYNQFKNTFLNYPIEFVCGDFFMADLEEADVIFCYLWDTVMVRIYEEKWESLKKGAILISHDFSIPALKPKSTKKVGRSKIYVYQKS